MKNRLFALTRDIFEKSVEPAIHAHYKRQGRPSKRENYLFFCAAFYILRTGISLRDLPQCFGSWSTIYMQFRRWSENGLFGSLLYKPLSREKNSY